MSARSVGLGLVLASHRLSWRWRVEVPLAAAARHLAAAAPSVPVPDEGLELVGRSQPEGAGRDAVADFAFEIVTPAITFISVRLWIL